MDLVSAVGVAAASAQLVNLVYKDNATAEGLQQRSTSRCSTSPISCRSLVNALDRLKFDVQVKRLDFHTICVLKNVVAGCKQQSENLDGIIAKSLKGRKWGCTAHHLGFE